MRFKKLDDDFRSSNIPTQQSLDFVRQESDLPGIKSMTNLQAGYSLTRPVAPRAGCKRFNASGPALRVFT